MCNKPTLEYPVIARSAATRQSSNACLTDALDCHAALAMTRVRDRAGCSRPFERGLTLIELLVFIVIIGIAANAMLAVFANLTRTSASLLPDKQAQAIANGVMQEVLAQPFANTVAYSAAYTNTLLSTNPYLATYSVAIPSPSHPPVAILGVPPSKIWLVTVSVTSPNTAIARFDGVRFDY